MKVLVIDTALGACTVGVFDGDRPLSVRSEVMSKGHAERIGGLVRDTVAEAGPGLGGFEALNRIGVTVGPGSFTGLRVGLAFAQGLGAALDVPVVGISTLAALAKSKAIERKEKFSGIEPPGILAAIDARRGQVYIQAFSGDAANDPAEAMTVSDISERFMPPAGFSWSLVGSGAPLVLAAQNKVWPLDETAAALPSASEWPGLIVNPTAEAMAALTVAADPADAPPTPLYLRAPDATPPTRLPGQARTPPPVRP